MLIGSWWRLEWYIMCSRIISQISGKVREFSPNFGNLVKISGIWIEYSSEFYEHFSDLNITVKHWNTTEFFNLLKFYGILVIPTEILNLGWRCKIDYFMV